MPVCSPRLPLCLIWAIIKSIQHRFFPQIQSARTNTRGKSTASDKVTGSLLLFFHPLSVLDFGTQFFFFSFFYHIMASWQVQDYSAPWRLGSLAVPFSGMAVLNDLRSTATHLQDFCHRGDSVFITQPPSLAALAPSSSSLIIPFSFTSLHPCSTHSLHFSAPYFHCTDPVSCDLHQDQSWLAQNVLEELKVFFPTRILFIYFCKKGQIQSWMEVPLI